MLIDTRATVHVYPDVQSAPLCTLEVVVPRARGESILNIANAAAHRAANLRDRNFGIRISVRDENLDSGRTLEDYGIDDETPIQVDVCLILLAMHQPLQIDWTRNNININYRF